MKLSNDMLDPNRAWPTKEAELPNREYKRKLMVLPKWANDKTLKVFAIRTVDFTLKELPTRQNERKESPLPRFM